MRRKGFTLVELLVVIGIIAMLMSILLPALAKVKAVANRTVCGTNLSSIGKSMFMYAGDFDGFFPVAGGPECIWCTIGWLYNWVADGPEQAYGPVGSNTATVSSSLYLLVKLYELTPKHFVCKGDIGTKGLETGDLPQGFEFTDIWDFGGGEADPKGGWSGNRCSYSYHMPYCSGIELGLPIAATSDPTSPVCADRNPYLDKNVTMPVDDIENAAPHQYEGQNVLFCGGDVANMKEPTCGIHEDNIWQYGDGEIPEQMGDGGPLYLSDSQKKFQDAYLVNEEQH